MKINHLASLTLIATVLFAHQGYAGDQNASVSPVQSQISSSEVRSPRDAASGLPTGKRQHKPVSVIKPIDKATPLRKSDNSANQNDLGNRSAYRLCPDGTMIHPGEKCPEKAARAK